MRGDNYRTDLINIDDREVDDLLSCFRSKKTMNLYRVQMKASARILQRKTIQNFMVKYNYNGVWKQEVIKKSGKKRTKTRSVAKVTSKAKSGDITVKVHILDDYKVKWLEMGTRERYTKGHLNIGYYRLKDSARRRYFLRVGKPGYRGKITPGFFFGKSINMTEGKIVSDMGKRLTNIFKKIGNGKS